MRYCELWYFDIHAADEEHKKTQKQYVAGSKITLVNESPNYLGGPEYVQLYEFIKKPEYKNAFQTIFKAA